MINKLFFSFLFSLGVLFGALPSLRSAEINKVENVIVTELEQMNSIMVAIESRRTLKHIIDEKTSPPRIVVLMKEDVECLERGSESIGTLLLKEIVYDCKELDGPKPRKKLLESVTLILNEESDFSVSQKAWILSVTLQMSRKKKSGRRFKDRRIVASGYKPGATIPRIALPSEPTVEDFIKVALNNHGDIFIATKELQLAKRKHLESVRNFFPVLSARASKTDGTTLLLAQDLSKPSSRADFERKEFGLEIGQPIFQSGRLLYSHKQTNAQIEVAELELIRIKQKVVLDVVKSLYTYIQLIDAVRFSQELSEKSENVEIDARNKLKIGVTSQSEFLGVLSLSNEIKYNTISLEKDLEIARAELLSVLNQDALPESISMDINVLAGQKPKLQLDLQEFITRALASRPEVRSSYLTTKVREFERKIARADKLFKLDASGFIGRSGSAFVTEDLKMEDSFNLGIKGVLYFGGSSLQPLFSKEKTAPDLGSTTRTETQAQSVTVGILDSMASGSGYMQSQIEEFKAIEEHRKVKMRTTMEVKEAYYNYQRGVIQIKFAKAELDYRKKEASISTARIKLSQVEPTRHLDALKNLTEAEKGLGEANAFFLISYAALEKALGSKLEK